jgi:cell division protein FtsL
MPNVESREIRGLTVKVFVLILSQAIVITATVVATYSNLKTTILLNRQMQQDYEKLNDQQIQNLQVNESINDKEMKGMQQQWNSFMIRYITDHSSKNK